MVAARAPYHSVFIGGGSDLLHVAEHYPDHKLFANDLDQGVADVWRAVIGPEDALENLESRIRSVSPRRHYLRARHPAFLSRRSQVRVLPGIPPPFRTEWVSRGSTISLGGRRASSNP